MIDYSPWFVADETWRRPPRNERQLLHDAHLACNPLDRLRASHELVQLVTAGRLTSMHHAREAGHSWGEIAAALQSTTPEVIAWYLAAIEGEKIAVGGQLYDAVRPELGYTHG